jgi:hypothetical protein
MRVKMGSIKIYVQIRAIEAIPAIGTGNLAIPFVHLMPAAVADVFPPEGLGRTLVGFKFGSWLAHVHRTGLSRERSNPANRSGPRRLTSRMTASRSWRNRPISIPRQTSGQGLIHFCTRP